MPSFLGRRLIFIDTFNGICFTSESNGNGGYDFNSHSLSYEAYGALFASAGSFDSDNVSNDTVDCGSVTGVSLVQVYIINVDNVLCRIGCG